MLAQLLCMTCDDVTCTTARYSMLQPGLRHYLCVALLQGVRITGIGSLHLDPLMIDLTMRHVQLTTLLCVH